MDPTDDGRGQHQIEALAEAASYTLRGSIIFAHLQQPAKAISVHQSHRPQSKWKLDRAIIIISETLVRLIQFPHICADCFALEHGITGTFIALAMYPRTGSDTDDNLRLVGERSSRKQNTPFKGDELMISSRTLKCRKGVRKNGKAKQTMEQLSVG